MICITHGENHPTDDMQQILKASLWGFSTMTTCAIEQLVVDNTVRLVTWLAWANPVFLVYNLVSGITSYRVEACEAIYRKMQAIVSPRTQAKLGTYSNSNCDCWDDRWENFGVIGEELLFGVITPETWGCYQFPRNIRPPQTRFYRLEKFFCGLYWTNWASEW